MLKDIDVPGVVARSMLVHIDNCFLIGHYNKEKEKSKDSFCLLWILWHGFFLLEVLKVSSITLDQEWSYLRGGLTTIDRDYGLLNNIHHDIGTHVIHHLFPQIPHYHLIEAVSIVSLSCDRGSFDKTF